MCLKEEVYEAEVDEPLKYGRARSTAVSPSVSVSFVFCLSTFTSLITRSVDALSSSRLPRPPWFPTFSYHALSTLTLFRIRCSRYPYFLLETHLPFSLPDSLNVLIILTNPSSPDSPSNFGIPDADIRTLEAPCLPSRTQQQTGHRLQIALLEQMW